MGAIQDNILDFNNQFAAVRHGLLSVHGEIHDDLFYLVRIAPDHRSDHDKIQMGDRTE